MKGDKPKKSDVNNHAMSKQSHTSKQSTDSREEILCNVCKTGKDENNLLLCDNCPLGFHMYCLGICFSSFTLVYIIRLRISKSADPPLSNIPEGDWFCPSCVEKQTDEFTQRAKKRKRTDSPKSVAKAEKPIGLEQDETKNKRQKTQQVALEMEEEPEDDVTCNVCKNGTDPDKLLLCDKCDLGYHLYCTGMICVGIAL